MVSAAEIAKGARKALAHHTRLAHAKINVQADDQGVVTLRGETDSYDTKITAQEAIERIRGVADIVNEISVIPKEKRTDDEISQEVSDALRRCAWVDESRLSVETINGVIFLRGTVNTDHERMQAEQDARWNAGVRDVINEIEIQPGVEITDADIERDARTALVKNTRIDVTEIGLTSANGEVRLSGRVPSYVLKRVAEYVVFTTPFVVNVVNDLRVEPFDDRKRSVAA